MNQSKVQSLEPRITMEGKEITFAEFLSETSGTGELFEDYIGKMLSAATEPNTQWDEVYNLIGPIAHHVIEEAIQEDYDLYEEIVRVIHTAWDKLRILKEEEQAEQDKDQEIVINENVPDVLHEVEGMMLKLTSGWKVKDATFYGAADMKVILTKTNEEN